MFSFYYIFERKIRDEKTLKNVADTVSSSFIKRDADDIRIQDNIITGKDSFIKLDFSRRSALVVSPGKGYFIYNEDTKILTYRIEAFYPILFNLIYAITLFLILHFCARHWIIELVVPNIFFILITVINYFQHQTVIDKISQDLNTI